MHFGAPSRFRKGLMISIQKKQEINKFFNKRNRGLVNWCHEQDIMYLKSISTLKAPLFNQLNCILSNPWLVEREHIFCQQDKKYLHDRSLHSQIPRNLFNFQHGRRKVHDYFLLLPCKSSIWFTYRETHFQNYHKFFNTLKCSANCVI